MLFYQYYKKWRNEGMKKLVAVLLVLAMVYAFAACSSGNTPASNTPVSEQPSTVETPDQSEETQGAKKTFKIAALLYSRAFEFMVALDEGIQNQCKNYGIEVTVLDGNSDSQTQIHQIEDCISAGYDAILLAANNSEELVAGVKKANEAGIPVVTLDGEVGEGCEKLAAVTFDNYAGGQTAADTLMSLVGPCTVLECSGASGAYHAVKRGGGFDDQMAKNKDYVVINNDCNWDAETAQNAVVDILSSNSNVKAVFTHNGEMVRGVIAGLKQINMLYPVGDENHITVVAVDGTPVELDYIRQGYLDATVEQNPFDMGALAVKIAYEYLSGVNTNPEAHQYVYPRVINSGNVDDGVNWGNQVG